MATIAAAITAAMVIMAMTTIATILTHTLHGVMHGIQNIITIKKAVAIIAAAATLIIMRIIITVGTITVETAEIMLITAPPRHTMQAIVDTTAASRKI